jgi:4-hydroxythreonine-4-phosphate dehydrogenase
VGERSLLLTPGMGIGPEVSARALLATGSSDTILIGRPGILDEYGVASRCVPWAEARAYVGPELPLVDPGAVWEPIEAAAVRFAAERCLAEPGLALCTGPIHKARLAAQGWPYHGHTDLLADITGMPGAEVMAFVGGGLRVALVTTHIPLRAVADALSPTRICHVVTVAVAALQAELGIVHPHIAVCGINPHAGEDGLLGTEERDLIAPALASLPELGARITGPISAETAFLAARRGEVDLIVAMYHDQGLAPLKAVDFGRSVNWTLGLPLIRTSVDHGTADSLVGTGRADPASMVAALTLARTIRDRRAIRAV